MQAIELVSFRLASNASQDFLAANEEINDWLASQPGFLRRDLAEGEDGTWLDVVVWQTMQEAHAAAAAMEAEAGNFVAMGMIDPASISMRHANLKLIA
jgi:antibiotic biosynthesis monooxygenase (ABM) superfamily enzyme